MYLRRWDAEKKLWVCAAADVLALVRGAAMTAPDNTTDNIAKVGIEAGAVEGATKDPETPAEDGGGSGGGCDGVGGGGGGGDGRERPRLQDLTLQMVLSAPPLRAKRP